MLHFVRLSCIRGFPGGVIVKEFTCQNRRHSRHGFGSLDWEVPLGRNGNLTPVFFCVENSMDWGACWPQFMGLHRVGQEWVLTHMCIMYKWLRNFQMCHVSPNYTRFFLKKLHTLNKLCPWGRSITWSWDLFLPPSLLAFSNLAPLV